MVGCDRAIIIGAFEWDIGVTFVVELESVVKDKNGFELLYVLFEGAKVVVLEVISQYIGADEGDGQAAGQWVAEYDGGGEEAVSVDG